MIDTNSDISFRHLVHTLTVARIPVAVGVLMAAVYLPSLLYLTIALVALVLMETSDVLDGFLARRLNVTSELGAMLDPYADSISRFTFFYALYITNNSLFFVPYVMFFRDITVAYSRVHSANQGKSISAKYSGKAKAWVQGLGALILILNPLVYPGTAPNPMLIHITSWIISVATGLSAVEYIYPSLRN